MEFTIHVQVLLAGFAIAAVMGAVMNKANFCTMGAVSDWVNIGDKNRLRAWLLAITVALAGVLALEASGKLALPADTFPPYRTAQFAWLRYLLGGALFGIGMTLASGCGSKTFVRIGGGSLKSLVVLAIAAPVAYLLVWTDFYSTWFDSWIAPTNVDLAALGPASQEIGALVAGLMGMATPERLHLVAGAVIVLALLAWLFSARDFRSSFDNMLGGGVVGLAIVGGWYVTGGPMGAQWKEYADFATEIPSRVNVQSYTFINPMGDLARVVMNPGKWAFVTFGLVSLLGVIAGSFLYALVARKFRLEWFGSFADFLRHVAGAVLLAVGGIMAMGCTIGQGITGTSTLALGSFLTLAAIIFGAALTMKTQYYLLDGKGVFGALGAGLADLRLLPRM
jgi:uncharacterized membrane protein YedE/YeeE